MSTVFEDLMEGLTASTSLESELPEVTPPATKTEVALSVSDKSEQFLKAHRMPDGVKTKVTKLVELMGHKDNSLRIDKFDYKIAHEVFAIIPEYVNAIQTSKLTRAPSSINATMVRDALIRYAPMLEAEVVNELYEYYSELFNIYTASKTDIQSVVNALTTFASEVQPRFEKLQAALVLVMVDNDQPGDGPAKVSVNVKTADIERLNKLKLINIDCNPLRDQLPYLVGRLNSEALLNMMRIVSGDSGGNMPSFTYGSISVMSILQVISSITNKQHGMLKDFETLESVHSMLCDKLNTQVLEIPAYKLEDAYRQYSAIVASLLRFKSVKANFDSKDSVLDTLDKLLELLCSI